MLPAARPRRDRRNIFERELDVPGVCPRLRLPSVREEVLKPRRRQFGVADRMPDVLVTEIGLDRPCILTGVGERVAGGVAQHVLTRVARRSTALIMKAFDSIVSKLTALQTPDHIIEIKLNPMIQGLSRAVNNFGKHAEMQAKAVDANLKQTQLLADALTILLAEAKARGASVSDRDLGAANHPAGGFDDHSPEVPEA